MIPRQYRLTIAFVALSGFITMSDFSGLSVALPSIAAQEKLNPTTLSLIGSMSTLMFASFMILGGRCTDLYGAVRTCVAGALLYLIGVVIATSASGAFALIAARALQGLGFALLGPAGFAKLNMSVPPGPARDRGLGLYAGSQGVAMILGSVFGGALTTYFGWRATFLMNVPVVLIEFAIAAVLLRREPERTRSGSLDVAGAALIAASTALLIWSLTKVGQLGWRSVQVLVTLGAALLGYLTFVLYERSLAAALIPRGLFREKRMISNTLATIGIMVAASAMFFLPNLYMQRVLGFSAAQSGIGMLPQALTTITTGGVLAYAVGRYSFRQNLVMANVAYLTGLSLFVLMPLLLPHAGYALIIGLPLVLSAFGGPFGAFAIIADSTANSPSDRQGIVTSVVMSTQQVALAVGVALALTIESTGEALGASAAASVRYAYIACVIAALLGAVCGLSGGRDAASERRANAPA
jgi:MFS family permease